VTGDQDLLGTWGPLVCLCLFAGMMTMHEVGRRLGMRRRVRDLEGSRLGLGPVESATFGLLGLLIAFTFSGAASRFDARRNLVTEEANFVEQAWLRVDLLPEGEQPNMRSHFRDYLDARLSAYDRLPDLAASAAELKRAGTLQRTIWKEAVIATRNNGSGSPPPFNANLVLGSINAMIEITTTRTMATRLHPPAIVYGMLFTAALMAALLAGYNSAGGKTRGWLHAVGLASIVSIALFVIIDVEHPRTGLVRVDAVDSVLRELRRTMN
jgi:hypothetical protein